MRPIVLTCAARQAIRSAWDGSNADLSPVRAWQFHPGGVAAENAGGYTTGQSFTDLGRWIGCWGIGATPDVRNPELIPSPTHNRSIITRDGQRTGIMEGTAFRGGVELSGSAANPGPTDYLDGSFTVGQKYDYFYVTACMTTYAESHPNIWLWGMKPTDTMSVAVDNVALRVSVVNPNPYAHYHCDFNLDGRVDVQDINPFIREVIDPLVSPGDLIIPEPAAPSLLTLDGLVLARRRR